MKTSRWLEGNLQEYSDLPWIGGAGPGSGSGSGSGSGFGSGSGSGTGTGSGSGQCLVGLDKVTMIQKWTWFKVDFDEV